MIIIHHADVLDYDVVGLPFAIDVVKPVIYGDFFALLVDNFGVYLGVLLVFALTAVNNSLAVITFDIFDIRFLQKL